ncbi:hypothetical protein [Bradyrhizobium stylosanthis]|uniref:Uncharacterized protein n=1 Tax=Bradyrhizobium stylosanthis TaxID=1803665 RepID=A0A560CXM4_9BRAD|nr:hypothetical protein [Bradyrhizobium stylosanthis]TWA89607.1 hypothetical protein FBZ96_11975 [Bradyrhizobium stylosanthis]
MTDTPTKDEVGTVRVAATGAVLLLTCALALAGWQRVYLLNEQVESYKRAGCKPVSLWRKTPTGDVVF